MNRRRHANRLSASYRPPELRESRVGIAGQRRQLVKERELLLVELLPRPRLCAPDIPWQHLQLVQRGEVANEIVRDVPEPTAILIPPRL